jgi:hypothetical protein
MIAQLKIPLQIFTCYLQTTGLNGSANHPGFYTFGMVDQPTLNACGGKFTFTKINTENGWWQYVKLALSHFDLC